MPIIHAHKLRIPKYSSKALPLRIPKSSNTAPELFVDSSPIPKRLREAREAAGLSQKELGIAAGIDRFSASPRINHYEQGRHQPNFQMIKKLAAVLQIPPPYFYAEDDQLAQHILNYDKG